MVPGAAPDGIVRDGRGVRGEPRDPALEAGVGYVGGVGRREHASEEHKRSRLGLIDGHVVGVEVRSPDVLHRGVQLREKAGSPRHAGRASRIDRDP